MFISLSVFEVLVAFKEAGHQVVYGAENRPGFSNKFVNWILGLTTISNARWLIGFSITSFAVAALMALHHHKVTRRVKEHQRFLGSLRGLTEEAVHLSVLMKAEEGLNFIEQRALQTLSEWRTPKKSGKREPTRFAAVLLKTNNLGGAFTLVCQWPPNTYAFDPKGIDSPCAAQKSVWFERLIYVPRTAFSHGAQLQWNESHESFTNAELAQDAFVPLSESYYKYFRPKSTICFMIPVRQSPRIRYVICLDAARGNPFKLVDYEAVHMIGSVVARVIIDLHTHHGHDPWAKVRTARR